MESRIYKPRGETPVEKSHRDGRSKLEGARAQRLSVCRFALPSFILFLGCYFDEEQVFFMPKRTFQPNRRRRSKTHGFRIRMKTKSGRAVISRRRAKGRRRVSVKPGFRE